MKRLVLLAITSCFMLAGNTQNYEQIKNMVFISPKKAKDDLDKNWSNAKFVSKPEGHLLKALVYSATALDNAVKDTPEGAALIKEAEAAYAKYREMQPDLSLLKDNIYQEAPLNLYKYYFNIGYKDYEAKKWAESSQTFEKVMTLSDFLIAQKIVDMSFDTNTVILAGITAEQANNRDLAAKHYSKLAAIKMPGQDYEGIYRFLMNYAYEKNDIPGFERYKALGKELYPKSEYFDFDKVDFARGFSNDFNGKLASLEDILKNDPNNLKALMGLAGEIYDTLYSAQENAVPPANAAQLEAKMVSALEKATTINPNDEVAFLLMGSHYSQTGNKINDKRKEHAEAMKQRTKPGAAASKEDVAKRDALDADYLKTKDNALPYYEKAAAIFAAKGTLNARQKQQYRNLAGEIADIYTVKKTFSKGKPADVTKFTAEEKKWNDLYDSLGVK